MNSLNRLTWLILLIVPACAPVTPAPPAPAPAPSTGPSAEAKADEPPEKDPTSTSKAVAKATQENADGLLLRARNARRDGQLDRAIDLAGQALELDEKHLQARALLAQLLQDKAMPLAQQKRWDDAKPIFLRSAEVARGLKGRKDPLTNIPAILATCVYNEACAYSMTREPEKALDSLAEALEHGFLEMSTGPGQPSPRELFITDPDLDRIREEKRFDELKEKYLPDSPK
jgi:hypothetical protein